jgi:molybdenum cofactor cytidylyltransferase
VVLAAGAGSRFHGDTHKLLALWRGRPVVVWALEHALAAGLDHTWVVVGAVDLVAAGVVPPGVDVRVNQRWEEGQATSLQVAVAAAEALNEAAAKAGLVGLGSAANRSVEETAGLGAARSVRVGVVDCLVVGLGDQPLVAPSVWRAVATSVGRPIAVASYEGRRRNPVRIDRDFWSLLPRQGDEGARVLIRQRAELVMEVACDSSESDPADIDTVEDLLAAEGD